MGRRLELLTIADNETLTYNVNPGYSRPSQFSRSVSSQWVKLFVEDRQASSLCINHHVRLNIGCCLSWLDQSSENEVGPWYKQMIIRQVINVQTCKHILTQMSTFIFLNMWALNLSRALCSFWLALRMWFFSIFHDKVWLIAKINSDSMTAPIYAGYSPNRQIQ